MAQEMKIFKKSYEFSKWLMEHTAKFPKSHRFSLSVEMERAVLGFLACITVANKCKNKMPKLTEADELLLMLRIFVRLSHDLKCFNTGSYEYGVKAMQEIGALLGGWMKSQK
jgi:hypothetical protein